MLEHVIPFSGFSPVVSFVALLLNYEKSELAPVALESALELRIDDLESVDLGAGTVILAGALGDDLVKLIEEPVFARKLFSEDLLDSRAVGRPCERAGLDQGQI